MPTIHAYRRKKTTIQAAAGLTLEFKPNDLGDVVCDVKDRAALEFLMSEPTAFRLYETQSAPDDDEDLSPIFRVAGSDTQATSEVEKFTTDPTPDAPQKTVEPPEKRPFLLVHGEAAFDLRQLDDDGLHAFAKANNIKVHHFSKGDNLRQKIVDALMVPTEV